MKKMYNSNEKCENIDMKTGIRDCWNFGCQKNHIWRWDEINNQPERSKREDSQDILFCSIRCAQEGNGLFVGPALLEIGYCKDPKCANYCYSNISCKMRCSEHCGNTVRDK